MKATLVLAVIALPLTAQTLTITPAGIVRLDPPPERTAELYAADSPRSQHWELVTEFHQLTQVDTNRTRFYRARVKAPPLKLLRITETNQTLRGSTDKDFTEILLVIAGVTNKGWSSRSSGRIGTTGTRMPVTVRSDFCFRRLQLTNPTPAMLIIFDDDGYVLTTNVIIGSGPYVPMLPPGQPQMLKPAADIQTQTGWSLVEHSSSSRLEGPSMDHPNCTRVSLSTDRIWSESGCWTDIEDKSCRLGKEVACGSTYWGAGGLMELIDSNGECRFSPTRSYLSAAEIGSYNSDTDDIIVQSRFEHHAASTAMMWIGGRLRGAAESNYWVRISIGLDTPERIGGNELIWNSAPSDLVYAIGGAKTSRHSIYLQVPPEGAYLNVTPSIKKMSSGLYRYYVEIGVDPAQN